LPTIAWGSYVTTNSLKCWFLWNTRSRLVSNLNLLYGSQFKSYVQKMSLIGSEHLFFEFKQICCCTKRLIFSNKPLLQNFKSKRTPLIVFYEWSYQTNLCTKYLTVPWMLNSSLSGNTLILHKGKVALSKKVNLIVKCCHNNFVSLIFENENIRFNSFFIHITSKTFHLWEKRLRFEAPLKWPFYKTHSFGLKPLMKLRKVNLAVLHLL
jgi:hypothetical protein